MRGGALITTGVDWGMEQYQSSPKLVDFARTSIARDLRRSGYDDPYIKSYIECNIAYIKCLGDEELSKRLLDDLDGCNFGTA